MDKTNTVGTLVKAGAILDAVELGPQDLADLAVEKLAPISGEMARLMQDPAEIDRILGKGADKADEIARPILEKTYEIMGMVRSR